jgi:arsenite methyltransferase
MAQLTDTDIRDQVRERYAAAATAVAESTGSGCCGAPAAIAGCGPDIASTDKEGTEVFGVALYDDEGDAAPRAAVEASLGCGVPTAVADLHEGETVLDLGSGAGADVLISARRVGESGRAIGLDMTDEMLELARANAAEAGVTNVEFLKGYIEDIPLPDASVDVVISNCVINLSTDKTRVLEEIFRVLRPGGRVGVSDVVAADGLSEVERATRGSYVGCIAGALTMSEYSEGLMRAGFTDVGIDVTHELAEEIYGANIRATKATA